MAIISNNYIIMLFIINILLFDSNEQFIENPKIILSEIQNPVIFNGNDKYYNIITSSNIYTIEKLTEIIKYINNLTSYLTPYFVCEDESNNHFLLADKDFYKINIDSNFENINLYKIYSFNSNVQLFGYIKHYQYYNSNDDLNIKNGEIIIYGKK